MKKHLRGRRYVRSRATVRIGRMRRQIRKIERYTMLLNRAAKLINNINWEEVFSSWVRFFAEAAEQVRETVLSLQLARPADKNPNS